MRVRTAFGTLDRSVHRIAILGLHDGDSEVPSSVRESPWGAPVAGVIASREFSGNVGETWILASPAARDALLLLVGLGKRERFEAGAAYGAGFAAGKKLAGKQRESVTLCLPTQPDRAAPFIEGTIVGTHGPGVRKSEPSRHAFGELVLLAPVESGFDEARLTALGNRSLVIAESVILSRELTNTPPGEKPPAQLANRMADVAKECGIEPVIWLGNALREHNMAGVLAVSLGSSQSPAMLRLSYKGAGAAAAIALVGKGVTFDSGGLSLKPTDGMKDMKSDMHGAASVFAAVISAAKLGLKVNIEAYLPMTENMTGAAALKLGDVIRYRNGTTVEVLNTDAEGRLILADALILASEQSPAAIVDLATLTGACIVALGNRVAGLFSTDDALASELVSACGQTGERAWRMPLDDDYADGLKSKVADLKNVGNRAGGAITAAKFLEKFVGSVPWAHLDIAGPSWVDDDNSTRDAGASGCFVRTLVAWLESRQSV